MALPPDGRFETDSAAAAAKLCGADFHFEASVAECATESCTAAECCLSNPTCGDVDGEGTSFDGGSCAVGTHLRDNLERVCGGAVCDVDDCCIKNDKCKVFLTDEPDACGDLGQDNAAVGLVCDSQPCTSDQCCTPKTCATEDVLQSELLCPSGRHLIDAPSGTTCTGADCEPLCCEDNPSCASDSFALASCDAKWHLVDDQAVVCATGVCASSDCCEKNQICGQLGNGTAKDAFCSAVGPSVHRFDVAAGGSEVLSVLECACL
jgi:hypothetical protein